MSAKVKTIKQTIGGDNKDISSIFNQLLGTNESINLNICYPKYLEIHQFCNRILDTLTLLHANPVFKRYDEFTEDIAILGKFITEQKARFSTSGEFHVDLSEYQWDYSKVPAETKEKFGEIYEKLKTDSTVNEFIGICNTLIVYKKHIEDEKTIDSKFILNMPGHEFTPFGFCGLNFKRICVLLSTDDDYDKTQNNQLIKISMLLLNKLYNLTYNLFKVVNKPDIDVDEFVSVIMSNIGEVKKRIPRCEKAFRKIEESVDLLKNNFGTYYKDFVESNNSTIIMENFVLDVANNTNPDTGTIFQFKQIIKYFRTAMKNNASQNPEIKMLFKKVSENFKKLDKFNNISKAQSGEFDDNAGSSDESSSEEVEQTTLEKTQQENSQKTVDELADEIEAIGLSSAPKKKPAARGKKTN